MPKGEKAAEKMLEAKKLVEQGWWRGRTEEEPAYFESMDAPCFCPLIAFGKVTESCDLNEKLKVAFYKAISNEPEKPVSGRDLCGYIAGWNDHQTDKQVVLNTFDRAAELLRSGT